MEFDELKGFLGDRFTTSKAIRIEHSHDESWHVPQNIPDAITYPLVHTFYNYNFLFAY